MTDLLTRLRAVESSRGTGDHVSNWHRNPDGPEAAGEIERLRSLVRFQDNVIRSGDTATLTRSEREAIHWVLGDVADITGPVEDALRGLLERFPSALSPMYYPPDADDGSEDERIWHSEKGPPD